MPRLSLLLINKKKISSIFVLFSLMLAAQNSRLIYEYTYRPDSTKADEVKSEWMFLDVGRNGSRYYSKSTFENDSIINESIRKQMASGMKSVSVSRSSNGGEIGYEVEKAYPSYTSYLTTRIGNDRYKVLDDRKILWTILPDKMKVGEFSAQQATGSFAGRKWTAWFTNDVPLIDGPYKFSGLPGLIVLVSDETGSHRMELRGIKKMASTSPQELNTQGKDIPFTNRKAVEVNRPQYAKLLKQYESDPVQGMREMMNRPDAKVKVNINGQEYSDPKEVLRALEQAALEEIKKNNNKIELIP